MDNGIFVWKRKFICSYPFTGSIFFMPDPDGKTIKNFVAYHLKNLNSFLVLRTKRYFFMGN